MKKISFVIPIYNEENSIINVTNNLKNVISLLDIEHEIICVNDGSQDKSLEILKTVKDIKVLNHPYNKGYGASLKTGIKQAKYEYICILDADNTYPIDALTEMVKYLDEYDMVVGARIGVNVDIPFTKKFAKFFITKLANYLVGKKIPDLNSGLRIFKKEAALINLNILPSGFSFTTTITIAMLSTDYFVHYHPIDYYERTGKSKIRPIKHTLEFLLLVTRLIVYFKPLKVFFPIGFGLFALGLLRTFYTIITRFKIQQLSIVLLLSGLMIVLIGLLADMFVKSRSAKY